MTEPGQPDYNAGQGGTGSNPGAGQPGQPGQQPGAYPGQPQGGYAYPGSQPGQPQGGYAYPGNPYGQMAPTQEPARPKEVNLAFWLLIATAVLGLIALPFTISYFNSPEYLDLVEQTARDAGLSVDPNYLSATIAGATVGAVLGSLFSLAVSVTLAFLVRAGYNWARIVVTVFAAFSLFGLIGIFAAGPMVGILTLLSILATVAAVVLLFLKPSNDYFNQKKAYRQARKFGGY